jgi:hypothetical protein
MKIWVGFDSEHSSRLVLIGHFTDTSAAESAMELINRLKSVSEEVFADETWYSSDERFLPALRTALYELGIYDMGGADIDNFQYGHTISRQGVDVTIHTDEGEIQGFIKAFLKLGARIQIYSRHDWTDTGEPQSQLQDND